MSKGGIVRALGVSVEASLDGLRLAGIDTDGQEITGWIDGEVTAFDAGEAAALRAAISGDDTARMAAEAALVAAVARALARADPGALVGFDGVAMAGGLRLGDGAAMADAAARTVVWDFRASDLRFGGQGGPIEPAFTFALVKSLGLVSPVAVLDIGAVATLTLVDPRCALPTSDGALTAFEAGPGLPIGLDPAAETEMDMDWVLALLEHPFFARVPPKLWPEGDANPPDAHSGATLRAGAAMAALRGLEHAAQPPERLIVTGPMRRDSQFLDILGAASECPVQIIDDLGVAGDDLPAQAAAYLGLRVARGLVTTFPATTGVAAAVGGGTISRPTIDD